MLDVELWQKPINNGKNTLPIIRVADKVFAYGKDGLHCYPTETSTRPSLWRKLGKTALDITRVAAKAFEIYAEKFAEYSPVNANPVQFAKTFATALVETAKNNPIWEELSKQDWSNAKIDVKLEVNSNKESSRNSSFNSRSFSSTS